LIGWSLNNRFDDVLLRTTSTKHRQSSGSISEAFAECILGSIHHFDGASNFLHRHDGCEEISWRAQWHVIAWTLAPLIVTGCGHAVRNNAPSDATMSTRTKLMTHNIRAWRDFSHQCNFHRIVDVVKEIKPDILCLNEALCPFAKPSLSASTSSSSSLATTVENCHKQVQNGFGLDCPLDPCFNPDPNPDLLQCLLLHETMTCSRQLSFCRCPMRKQGRRVTQARDLLTLRAHIVTEPSLLGAMALGGFSLPDKHPFKTFAPPF